MVHSHGSTMPKPTAGKRPPRLVFFRRHRLPGCLRRKPAPRDHSGPLWWPSLTKIQFDQSLLRIIPVITSEISQKSYPKLSTLAMVCVLCDLRARGDHSCGHVRAAHGGSDSSPRLKRHGRSWQRRQCEHAKPWWRAASKCAMPLDAAGSDTC